MVPLGRAVRLPPTPVAWKVALVMPVLHQGEALGTGVGMTERVLVAEGAIEELLVTVDVRVELLVDVSVAVRELLGVGVVLGVTAGVRLAEGAAGEEVRLTVCDTLGLPVREAVCDTVIEAVTDELLEVEGLGLVVGATGEGEPVALFDPVADCDAGAADSEGDSCAPPVLSKAAIAATKTKHGTARILHGCNSQLIPKKEHN